MDTCHLFDSACVPVSPYSLTDGRSLQFTYREWLSGSISFTKGIADRRPPSL